MVEDVHARRDEISSLWEVSSGHETQLYEWRKLKETDNGITAIGAGAALNRARAESGTV